MKRGLWKSANGLSEKRGRMLGVVVAVLCAVGSGSMGFPNRNFFPTAGSCWNGQEATGAEIGRALESFLRGDDPSSPPTPASKPSEEAQKSRLSGADQPTATEQPATPAPAAQPAGKEKEAASEKPSVESSQPSAHQSPSSVDPGASAVSPEQIAEWIRQLGDDSYEVRQRATGALCQAGLVAADALKQALKHPDLEVRRRARWILADVLEAEHRRRLEKFLADSTGSPEHRLPLWTRYRELIGYDEGARKMFVAMQRAEPALLEAAEAGGTGAVESMKARLQQINQRMNFPDGTPYQPSLGTIATFLFLISLPELELPQDIAEAHYAFNLVHQAAFQQVLNGPDSPQKSAARRLLAQWILCPMGPQAVQTGLLHNRLQLAVQHRLPEGLVLAFEILQSKEPTKTPPYLNAFAVCAVGLLGGKPYAEHLVPMLDSPQECQRFGINNKQFSIQVRDVALAWLVYLTDQKHEDYGMKEARQEFERLQQIPQYFPNFSQFRYSDDTSRDEAIGKFRKWLAEHPLPKSPEAPKRPVSPKPPPEKRAEAQPVRAPLAPLGGLRAAVVNRGALNATSADPQGEQKFFLPKADRLLVRSLAHSQEAIRQRRFAEAARILGDILADEKDYAFQPDGAEPLYRCIKSEAARLLSQMPPEGLQTYQTLYEPRAKKALQEASALRDPDRLISVAERFFLTPSGAEAMYLVGLSYLDRGQPMEAALVFRRLRAHPQVGRFEPILSVLEALSWYQTGDVSAAETVLGELSPELRGAAVYLAGQRAAMFAQPAEAIPWLRTKLGLPVRIAPPEGWFFVHGNPAHNPAASLGAPYLSVRGRWPVCEESIVAEVAQEIREKRLADLQSTLAKLYPLVISRKVVFRTATALRAVDLPTGRLLWEAPMEDPLRLFLQPYLAQKPPSERSEGAPSKGPPSQKSEIPSSLKILPRLLLRQLESARPPGANPAEDEDGSQLSSQRLREILSAGLKERFWEDTPFGLLSSDGQRVYGIEDVNFRFPMNFQRVVVTADGRRRPEPFLQKSYNLLVAYDGNTGKAIWEVGGPPDVEGMTLGGAYFLGPPISLGGRLYTAAVIDNETRLLELDPDTGQVLTQLVLSGSSRGPEEASPRAMLIAMGLPLHRLRLVEVPHCVPAYSDGIMVCRTAENHYVAVDLLTRSIRWVYEASQMEEEIESLAPMFGGVPLAIRQAYAALRNAEDGWSEASIVLGEGFVVLTPPQTDKLICLRLHDGHNQWSVPRRDGLFVAAVAEGQVVVVGRESVWAVRLEDGAPAWPHPIALPAGSLPSGRGYRQGHFYYLPLSTAEVAVCDLRQGRLSARCRSPQGIIPGNLVACAGVILSQDVDGVYQWELLADRAQQTAAALAQSPDRLQAQLDHAEVLSAQGRLQEALELLCQAKAAGGQAVQTDSRFQQLVIRIVEDGLQQDPAAFLSRLAQIETLLDRPERQPRFLRQLAQAYHQQGQIEAAFEKYLALVQTPSDTMQEPERRSASHEVRQDRWIAGRLAELYHQASPELRTQLDAKIAPWDQDDRLEQFVRYFGFHPRAAAARVRLAQQEAQAGRWARAEWLLQTVLEQGSAEEQRLAAVRWAELLRKANRPEAAAGVYRLLADSWSDVVCADGKTGRQLLAALPADDPVRRWVDRPFSWPAGQPKVEVLKRSIPPRQRFSIRLTRTSPASLLFHVGYDPNTQQLEIFHPSGRKLETISVPPAPMQGNYTLYSYSQGVQRGHVVVAWVASSVTAVDLLSQPPQLLWTQPLRKSNSREIEHPIFAGFVGRNQMRQLGPFQADEPLPLVVTSHAVCFQQDRRLVAVDPFAPADQPPLWSRRDVPLNADLFGDDELIFVTGPGQKEATVLSSFDGRVLGTRPVPDMKHRLLVLGRRVLCWKATQEVSQAVLVDPWTQQTLWTRSFPQKSQPWVLPEGKLAVLDIAGRLSLLDLPTGNEVFHASVDPEPNLDGLIVLASPTRYVVIANRPLQSALPIFLGRNVPDTAPVHGRITALDRRTGNPLWSTEVLEQNLRLNVPVDLPVLVFYNIYHKQEKNPQGHIQHKAQEAILCLDSRTGAVLHQSVKDGISGFWYDIVADMENRNITVETSRETIHFRYESP